MRILRVLAVTVGLSACTTRSQVQIARPGPNLEVRDGTCAEQRAVRADQPIVHCDEFSQVSAVGGVVIGVGIAALASLMLVEGIRDFGEGLGKADDH